MSRSQARKFKVGKAGWFGVGALAASVAFVLVLIAGDLVQGMDTEAAAQTDTPSLIIEAK